MRAVLTAAAVALVLTAPADAEALRLKRVGTFAEPVYLTSPPGRAGTLAVVERYGRVRLVRHGHVQRHALLDIRRRVRITHPRAQDDQRGLLSLAFAPDYASSGRLYVDYIDRHNRLRVDEWQRGTHSLRRVLDLGRATTKHHGGQLQFGPDGRLYVSTGMTDDPSTSQDPTTPGGKVLRMDPLARPAQPEVVALGLRNPWRFSFDPLTGAALIGDVGEHAAEEVDVLLPGEPAPTNFGWPAYEGDDVLPAHAPIDARLPALVHLHRSGWCAVIGGYVAHGHAPRALRGRYVYGDMCSGGLRTARLAGTSLLDDARVHAPRVPYLVSFGEDTLGRLYVVSFRGGVWRLI